MGNSLKHKILSGMFWQGLERIGSQGISFVISIVLARLLVPEEFGVVAILILFTGICAVFVDSGFGAALVQRQNLTERDCCSVFYANIIIAVVMYAVLFFSAPWIADFFHVGKLSTYLRVMALTLPIRSISNVQNSLLVKRMLFHLSFRINWIALLVSGCIGILLAYLGFGVWALITQQIISDTATTVLLCFFVRWKPQLIMDYGNLKEMFRYGGKLFFSSLLDRIYHDIYSFLIGKLFNVGTLAYFERGRMFPSQGMQVINSTLGSVLFPALSEIQHDAPRMRNVMEKSIRCVMYMVIPILTMIFIFSEALVKVLLSDKWLPCVIFIQLNCIIFLFWPLHTLNLKLLMACGKSNYFLLLEIIKKIQLTIIILLTFRHGVIAMVLGLVVSAPLSFIENAWFSRQLINYPFWRQFYDIVPDLILSAVGAAISFFVIQGISDPFGQIIAGCGIFGVYFMIVSLVRKPVPVRMCISLISKRIEKSKFLSQSIKEYLLK